MKVCFLANTGWYLQNFRANTLRAFVEAGHDVVVLCPKGSGEENLSVAGVRCETFRLDNAGTNPFVELGSLIELAGVIRRIRPDCLYSFNPKTNLYGLLASRLLGVRCIPNVSGVGSAALLRGLTGWIYSALVKVAYRRAEFLFFQNEEDREVFGELGLADSTNSLRLPGSGVDLERFSPDAENAEGHGEPVRFLMASRLIYPKGVVEYLRAAKSVVARYTNVECLLAGVPDGSDRAVPLDVIRSYCSEDSQVRFLGHVEEMSDVLTGVTAVVLPSSYPEGVPRSLLEGLAAGKLIVTTDRPGCRDALDEGVNGFFVQEQSVDSLVSAMEKVLALDEHELRAMSRFSRQKAETGFDESAVIEAYLMRATPC
ncbi:glycosyltransferase involved in cell wall biosynthesis [Tamilnaduibacter salinus]|uniref:Glycosyltransferase involved in cell wall biosynthesis n=1 Tax=Tamilnaduibacter salinus TaxID=1484056 RepID=A0A2U1CUY2_9GAMM|nr:glycosyltransferase family 4 protein [Tamilnaduibacter salinus]PVY70824.1 glycosyltransferase involved in cell wall biosynthesis [Tamilnaduibacter salinus]